MGQITHNIHLSLVFLTQFIGHRGFCESLLSAIFFKIPKLNASDFNLKEHNSDILY